MKHQSSPQLQSRSVMSSILLIALAALLIISPWLITQFWLHTLFHAYYLVPSILVTGGLFIWEITNQSTDELNNTNNSKNEHDPETLSIDSSSADADLRPMTHLPTVPSLDFLIKHLSNPEIAKKIMSAISEQDIPDGLQTSTRSVSGSPRAIGHLAQNAGEKSWLSQALHLLNKINQAHSIGLHYLHDPNDIKNTINVIDVYNFIKHGNASNARSLLIDQVKKILTTHIEQAIENLKMKIKNDVENPIALILMYGFHHEGQGHFQTLEEYITSIITPLESLKHKLNIDGDLQDFVICECSHFIKSFMTLDPDQPSVINSTIDQFLLNIFEDNILDVFTTKLFQKHPHLKTTFNNLLLFQPHDIQSESKLQQDNIQELLSTFTQWSNDEAIASLFENKITRKHLVKLKEADLKLEYTNFKNATGRRNKNK